MKFFGCQEFFFVNFDFKNGCKNEFEDNNEKSCGRFENRVPLKIDFRADWAHESIPTAWELNKGESWTFNRNFFAFSENKFEGTFPEMGNFSYLSNFNTWLSKFLISMISRLTPLDHKQEGQVRLASCFINLFEHPCKTSSFVLNTFINIWPFLIYMKFPC